MLQWSREEPIGRRGTTWIQYTVWTDGDNHLSGAIGSKFIDRFGVPHNQNVGAPVDLTCATEVLPAVPLNGWPEHTMDTPPGDPP